MAEQPQISEFGNNRLVRGRYGYVIYNKNDIVVGRMMEMYGEYFESEVDLFRRITGPGDVVVDAGANIGTHTLALARLVGDQGWVYAFEAQHMIHQMLCGTMALNGLLNVQCVHAALGATNGYLYMADVRPDLQNNLGGIPVDMLKGHIKTAMVKLDDFIEASRIKLIKIDVEGMEQEVLVGGHDTIRKHRPVLYVENDRAEKSEQLIESIKSLDYRIYWHFPQDFNPNNFFGSSQRLFSYGFIESGKEYLETIGFAINLLCLPAEAGINVTGFREVQDAKEHPMKRDYNKLFLGP